jgi:hypothetical protein
MPVRKATPEETQAFWGKPVVISGQRRPESQKAPQNTALNSEEDRLNMLSTLGLISKKWSHQVAQDVEQEPPEEPTGQS